MTDTERLVAPVLYEAYGKNATSEALAAHLAEFIDRDPFAGRKQGIVLACWLWFPGGTTAEDVARRIEAALEARDV